MRYRLALLLMLPLLAWAQPRLPACTAAETDLDARRHNCFGAHTYPTTKCVGEWWAGELHGQGTTTFLVGATYVGEYQDGSQAWR